MEYRDSDEDDGTTAAANDDEGVSVVRTGRLDARTVIGAARVKDHREINETVFCGGGPSPEGERKRERERERLWSDSVVLLGCCCRQ